MAVEIRFTNAEVEDCGFGLRVNGESLEDIISMALGTKAKGVNYGNPNYDKLKKFSSNACDVMVVIAPHPKECKIEDDENVYHSVEDLEADIDGRISKETTEAESES